ncbi:MAG: DNA repair protein RecO [Tenacibaculum sp.]
MNLLKTKAIVFNSLRYGNSSLIVRCFTSEQGMRSYLLKGVLGSRKGGLKPAYFQPLSQLEIVAYHKQNSNLHTIKEVQIINPYNSVFSSLSKQTIVLFLSEILSLVIKEEEKNDYLYTYLETALIWLDNYDEVSNFHLLFLLNLSKILGFYPDITHIQKNSFNLAEGRFTNSTSNKSTICGAKLVLFKGLLGLNFNKAASLLLSKNERKILLKIILDYFELHAEGFKKPKSLAVLESVFS